MAADKEWQDRAKRLIKSEMKLADVTYDELARRLVVMGIAETKASIASKISRGLFPMSFFLASMKAIGVERVTIGDRDSQA